MVACCPAAKPSSVSDDHWPPNSLVLTQPRHAPVEPTVDLLVRAVRVYSADNELPIGSCPGNSFAGERSDGQL
jgi:hypothetical protein